MKARPHAIVMTLLFVAAAGLVAAEHEDWDGDEESGDSSPNMCEKGTHFRGDATAYMVCEMEISDQWTVIGSSIGGILRVARRQECKAAARKQQELLGFPPTTASWRWTATACEDMAVWCLNDALFDWELK